MTVNRDLEYKNLESEIYNYFLEDNKILGSIIIGSRAFSYSKRNDLSDLDLIIYTLYPEDFINNVDWVNKIRKVKRSYFQHWDMKERKFVFTKIQTLFHILRVEFIDGLMADFVITIYDKKGFLAQLNKHPVFIDFNKYYGSTKRMFLDKEGIITKIFEILKNE
ncbi:MAG: hypothetical protein ACW98X_00925 [Promethearchaeota archaeon]|jgi:hypothetical protein